MMKKTVFLILTILLNSHQVHAQQTGSAQVVCDDPTDSLLWHIQGNDSDVYLFGSIHVGKADFYPMHSVIENAFQGAENLVFEVDPQATSDLEVAQLIMLKGIIPDGGTLRDILSHEVMTELEQTLARLGMPVESVMYYQPWFLTLFLNNLQVASLGFLPHHGVEMYLASRKSAQVNVLELESVEEQIGFLQELNGEMYLKYTLLGFENDKEKITQMIHAWQCGNKSELSEIIFSELDLEAEENMEMEVLKEKMFFQRNRQMAEGIREYLVTGKDDYFVVVGAGHLIGEGSVIDILDDEYEINEVRLVD